MIKRERGEDDKEEERRGPLANTASVGGWKKG